MSLEIVVDNEPDYWYSPLLRDRYTALGKFTESVAKTHGERKLSELINDFENPSNYILLVDSQLL